MQQYPTELRLEMTVLMELDRFVKATYTLEGDGDLVFITYQKLEQLKAFIQVENYATLTAAMQELFPLSPALQYQWYNCGLHQCLQPAFTYFLNTMTSDQIVSQSVALFKAAQLFSPRYIKISRPTATNVNWLRVVPFLSSNNVIQSLKDELPGYTAKANSIPDVCNDLIDTLPWWKATTQDLPCRAAAVQKMVLVQPSSAAAERVLSLLVTMFGDQQHEALEDYLEAALMLRINSR